MIRTDMSEKSIFSKKFEISIVIVLAAIPIVLAIASWAFDRNMEAINTKIDSKFEQISTSINSKFEQISTKFDYFEKYSEQKIENEVNKARLHK